MKSLYISLISSQRLLEKLRKETRINPGYAGQKFNRLIIEGLIANGVDTKTLSSIPMNRRFSKKIFWHEKKEKENGITYQYIPFLNIPHIHHLCLFSYTFLYILFWGAYKTKDKFVLMDVLNISICLGALLASKINGLHCVGVVTDMPGLMVGASDSNMDSKEGIVTKINKWFIHSFDSYVLLTEQMNDAINKHNKPYIIMEGLCDTTMKLNQTDTSDHNVKSLLYAGGLHERYGLKLLTDAFMSLPNPNYRLIIYGSGPFVDELEKDAMRDPRVEYRGLAQNDEVMRAEYAASVLVNPRPTTEEFTKYSFPSKNIEYMSTGRPLLTTKLPGMPTEYYPHIYLFEEETLSGYAETIERVLSNDYSTLYHKGTEAQEWVLRNKNNISQTNRIIQLVNSTLL